jgi:hypothetical protein
MDGIISHVFSPYLLYIKSEERLFFPQRQLLRRYADASADAGVGEAAAEGNEIVSLSPIHLFSVITRRI